MPPLNLRPRRPYRNLEEFRQSLFYVGIADDERLDAGFWPCPGCGGKGKVRDPEDRDIIEGYKLAPWHPCGNCGGTGRTNREAIKAIYDQKVARWKAKVKAWKETIRLRKAGLRKLTKEEKGALGL